MASSSSNAAHDDLDTRCVRIRQRLLDGIEQTLDELALPDPERSLLPAAIAPVDQSHVAPLACRQALCRRAKRCRRQPCSAPQGMRDMSPSGRGDFFPKVDYAAAVK